MKKIILSGIALLFISSMYAQHVQFGVKGGVNIADLKDDANTSTSSKTGFNVGGLAHIHLTSNFAIQPEVVYSTQGAEYSNGAKNKLSYVNIPVLGQYMFSNGFRLQTGPQVGILAAHKIELGNTEIDVDDAAKDADFGWVFGASYLTKSGFGLDGRYNLGITDISKNEAGLKNRVWQFGVFYQFQH